MKSLLKCQETMIIQQENFYLYHQKYYKLIDIDLSRQANTNISQENNFTEKLEENDGATKKQQEKQHRKATKNYSKLFFRFIKVNRIMYYSIVLFYVLFYCTNNRTLKNIEFIK